LARRRCERKQLVHAFIAGITVEPDECGLDLQVRPLPMLDSDSSVGMVAGARYEPVQKILELAEQFVAGDLPWVA
jgi:hypothetical protein